MKLPPYPTEIKDAYESQRAKNEWLGLYQELKTTQEQYFWGGLIGLGVEFVGLLWVISSNMRYFF